MPNSTFEELPEFGSMSHLGALAEWLRSGLQSRLHRFDSGGRLWIRAESSDLPGVVHLQAPFLRALEQVAADRSVSHLGVEELSADQLPALDGH